MARGYVYQASYTTPDGQKRRTAVWYIGYSINGKKVRESSKSENKADAEALLAQRLAETRRGGPTPSEMRAVTFETLERLLLKDYERKGNRSDPRTGNLAAFFEGWKAADIDESAISRYVDKRQDEKAANGTISRELAILRRMLNLGHARRLVARVPSFDGMMLAGEVREGFVTEDSFQKLRAALPDYLQPLVETLYLTGWRRADVLSRTWADVDLAGGWLTIGRETKEKTGRSFPLIPRLRAILEAQRAKADEIEAETGREVEYVFFHYRESINRRAKAGDPIRDFRRAWATACKTAEVPKLRVHDLRRSAIRHFIRAGVSENVARAYSGHKTAAVFSRYNITSQADLEDGGAKLSAFFEGEGKGTTGKVQGK
jgi:integrase